MKVLNYEAHHVMGVEHIDFDLGGWNLFHIGGANGQGKSSAIKSLLMALCGRSGMDFPKPALREGEDEGWIKVKLSGSEELHEDDHLVVELRFERKEDGSVTETFRVVDSTGEDAPEPRTLLKRLYRTRAFDPLSFDGMSKSERRKVLMDVVGLDFSGFELKRKLIYEDRASINKERKRRLAFAQSSKRHEGLPEEQQSTAELFSVLKEIESSNEEREAIETKAAILAQRADFASMMVKSLKAEIETKKLALKEKQEEVKKHKLEKAGLKKEMEDVKSKSPKPDSVESVRQKIVDVNELNSKIMENEAYSREVLEAANLLRKSEEMTCAMKSMEEEQDALLAKTKWPIEGISVDQDGVILDGLPFESACLSRRISASVNVGMALNPELRLLVCEDGSSLDLDTLQQIQDELKEKDYTMLIEVVTRTEDDEDMCAVVIKEGKVYKERGVVQC